MSNVEKETYVYIDVSNIRGACLRSLGLALDFVKLMDYLKAKYPKLKEVRYYEGISEKDTRKERYFKILKKKGYKLKTLRRKRYNVPAKKETFICKKCGAENQIEVLPPVVKMKSNVDVFLAADMMYCAARNLRPIHIMLVACDGDYKESIDNILRINPEAVVSILATPYTPKRNSLSGRLQIFGANGSHRTALINIASLGNRIFVEPRQ